MGTVFGIPYLSKPESRFPIYVHHSMCTQSPVRYRPIATKQK